MYHGGVTWRNEIEISGKSVLCAPMVIGNFGYRKWYSCFCKSQRPRDELCQSGVMRERYRILGSKCHVYRSEQIKYINFA
jgi:hypothetical protein